MLPLTWHHGSGGGGPGLALPVYDGLPGQRRLELSRGQRGPTLSLDLATSGGQRLGGEAGHGGQGRGLDVEHLYVIVTLHQSVLNMLMGRDGRGEAVTHNHPLERRLCKVTFISISRENVNTIVKEDDRA